MTRRDQWPENPMKHTDDLPLLQGGELIPESPASNINSLSTSCEEFF